MDDIQEQRLGGLIVRIDRSLCVGFGDCVARAPQAFEPDDDDLVALAQPEAAEMECLLEACESCPVDALSVVDASGRTLCPSRYYATPCDE